MKRKVKISDTLLKSLDLGITKDERPEDSCIKRMHFDGDYDEVLPHENDFYSVGTITSIDVDADGDVVLPSALDTKRYEKNPIPLQLRALPEVY